VIKDVRKRPEKSSTHGDDESGIVSLHQILKEGFKEDKVGNGLLDDLPEKENFPNRESRGKELDMFSPSHFHVINSNT
jgi:hypothetical protein